MKDKKFGSFFEAILGKSPDLASRLKGMSRETTPEGTKVDEQKTSAPAPSPPTSTSERKPTNMRAKKDPLEGVIVEKRTLAPRLAAKPKVKLDNRARSRELPKKAKKLIQRSQSQASTSPKPEMSTKCNFFDGVPEYASQFGQRSGAPLDIVVGVDFGTSSTKIVIRVPNFRGEPAYAVPFGKLAHKSLQYLLPTRIAVTSTGKCFLTPVSGASLLTEIKVGLMKDPTRWIECAAGPRCVASAETLATAYLALVLRYARSWFLATKRDAFGDYPLNWSFNLGLPAAIDDDERLRHTYDAVGKAAWLVSRKPGTITIDRCAEALRDIKASRIVGEDLPWDFQLVPEVVAEVTGYARSRFKNEGLHLLVDIGASTLDVCSFIVRQIQGDDDFPLLTADVDLLGARRLHLERIAGAKTAIDLHTSSLLEVGDPLALLPEDPGSYAPSEQDLSGGISEADRAFKAKGKGFLAKTLVELRTKRDPNSSRWSEKLPVFVCGGATAIGTFKEIVAGVDEHLRRHVRYSKGSRIIQLPKPETLDADVTDENYHRLAVAWGLSYEPINIPTYSRPSEIEDIPPPPVRDIESAYVSKDMV